MKIKITADSTIDLTPELIKKYDIATLPLVLNLGDDTYYDNVDVTAADIYKYFDETGNLPKTGARSPEDFKDFFKKWVDQGYEVIHIGIGSDLSGS